MRFYYKKIILWTKKGTIREIEFVPNKVNIITGGSETGKSSILGIIDYCFFQSENIRITEKIINENILCYGLLFNINGRNHTIVRGAMEDGKPSNKYYYSSIGEIPVKPNLSFPEIELKKILRSEFSISEKVVVPYGGNVLRAGNRLSMKYFMLFNSQDENTIDHTDTYFDKQIFQKYKEGLDRVFDIATGISTEEDILITERYNQLSVEIARWERKQEKARWAVIDSMNEKNIIVKEAKKMKIINQECDIETGINIICDLIEGSKEIKLIDDNFEQQLEELVQKERYIKKQLRELKYFKNEVAKHNTLQKNNMDSLKPIEYINNHFSEIIEHPYVKNLVDDLQYQLEKIKESSKSKLPSDFNFDENEKELKQILDLVVSEKNQLTKLVFENTKVVERYVFLGSVKERLKLISMVEQRNNDDCSIEKKREELKNLSSQLEDRTERKNNVIKQLEFFIGKYLEKSESAMDTYKGFIPVFNYQSKTLQLRDPITFNVANFVGSSSNYVFLHLCFSLGLHELFINKGIPYIPSYLILDQPSRPYYDNDNEEVKDRLKITTAIKLLNDFIDEINFQYNEEFQIIVLEHIPQSIWKGMKNIHLVEEFKGNNKLIRDEDIK